jgi:hypothetical protein
MQTKCALGPKAAASQPRCCGFRQMAVRHVVMAREITLAAASTWVLRNCRTDVTI